MTAPSSSSATQTWDQKRLVLALIAFVAGGAVPIQLVTISFGYAQYVQGVVKGPELISTAHEVAAWYVPFVYVPALVVLAGIALYSRRRYPSLFRRIVVGFGAGIVATLALDAWRQTGVIYGWLPGDTPKMFGRAVTGSKSMATWYPVGLVVHYFNGANFGLFYAFVWGKRGSYRSAAVWATLWMILVEVGMMTLPPMGPMTGLFGVLLAGPLSHHARGPRLRRACDGAACRAFSHGRRPGLAPAVSEGPIPLVTCSRAFLFLNTSPGQHDS